MNRKSMIAAFVALTAAGCNGPKGSSGQAGPSGPIGPGGVIVDPPAITGVSPGFASPAMLVTITGENFSTTAANDHVTFGGAAASVVSATATSIVVNPPAGAATSNGGVTGIVVEVGGKISNTFSFLLGQAGDSYPVVLTNTAPRDGQVAKLPNGKIVMVGNFSFFSYGTAPLVLDSATGVISQPIAEGSPLFSRPTAVRVLDADNVLILDGGLGKLMKYNPTTGAVSVYRGFQGYYYPQDFTIDATTGDIYISWVYGLLIEKLGADGSDNPYFSYVPNSGPCYYGWTIENDGTNLYIASSNFGTVCKATLGSSAFSVMSLSGSVPQSVSSLRFDGTNLIAGGISNTGVRAVTTIVPSTGVSTVDSVTIPSDASESYGNFYGVHGQVFPLGAGEYLYTTLTSLYQVNTTGLTLLSGSPSGDPYISGIPSSAQGLAVHANGKRYIATNANAGLGDVAAIYEINVDGSSRVMAARTTLADTFGGLEISGTDLLVAGGVAGVGTIDQIAIATGIATPLVTNGPAPIFSFVRDATGSFLTFDGTASVAQYDGQGMAQVLGYITLGSGAKGATRVGNTLYIPASTEIDTVNVTTGGAATATLATVGLSGASAIAFDKNNSMVIVDDNALYNVTAEGYLDPWLTSSALSTSTRQIFILNDGQVLAVDGNNGVNMILP